MSEGIELSKVDVNVQYAIRSNKSPHLGVLMQTWLRFNQETGSIHWCYLGEGETRFNTKEEAKKFAEDSGLLNFVILPVSGLSSSSGEVTPEEARELLNSLGARTTHSDSSKPNPTNLSKQEEQPSNPKPVKRPYGVWVVHCPCGWKTLGKVREENPPSQCRACGSLSEVKGTGFDNLDRGKAEYIGIDEIACMIATVADIRGQRVHDHCERHGLLLYQVSKLRYYILRREGNSTVKYADGEHRAVGTLQHVHGPCNYQDAMAYLKKTSKLPEYLHD